MFCQAEDCNDDKNHSISLLATRQNVLSVYFEELKYRPYRVKPAAIFTAGNERWI
jgi:hypothetical protein